MLTHVTEHYSTPPKLQTHGVELARQSFRSNENIRLFQRRHLSVENLDFAVRKKRHVRRRFSGALLFFCALPPTSTFPPHSLRSLLSLRERHTTPSRSRRSARSPKPTGSALLEEESEGETARVFLIAKSAHFLVPRVRHTPTSAGASVGSRGRDSRKERREPAISISVSTDATTRGARARALGWYFCA